MAPRKGKSQGKRNNIKIKSKLNKQKRGLKSVKKASTGEKPLDNLKWINKLPTGGVAKKCEAVPEWLDGCVYKQKMAASSSAGNSSEYPEYEAKNDDKSSSSDASEECNCPHPDINKYGILKRKFSSTNSLMAEYIKSGMDHVASFIVESAIRFGEEHGVVVPDKNSPNVYEITSPNARLDDKCRKIRFKIPEKTLGYEEAKKVMWRSPGARRAQSPTNKWDAEKSNSASWESVSDSLEDILPLLEKLKEGGGGIVSSELDLEKLTRESTSKEHLRKGEKERERDRDRERERDRDRDRDRERDREREREKDRDKDREKERVKDRFRTMSKRYKSVGPGSEKPTDDRKYSNTAGKSIWKRFKRDSVELGRERLRASTCPRKQKSLSPTPY